MHVMVVSYRPEWPALFEAEAGRLRAVFGSALRDLHHIGSTSIPGLAAKPVIDMIPVLDRIEAAEERAAALADLGYEGLGENGISGRRYCRKGGDDRTHQLHCFAAGNPHIRRHLAFRDFLRAHPGICDGYAALKSALAAAHPEDIEGYMQGKDAFIQEVEQMALAWYGDGA